MWSRASCTISVSQAQAERSSTAAQMQPAPALVLLGQQLGLSSFEQDILLLCAAPELDMRVASLCAQAHSDANRAYPTFALALSLSMSRSGMRCRRTARCATGA